MKYTAFFTALIFILFLILMAVYSVFYRRVGAFGCFDDCHTFTTAYFMTKGKQIYSQIFYNHQMLMPYLSYLIQSVFNPKTLYNLVLYHRFFIIGFSILANILLVLRFKWKGVGFAAIYESTKFYLFGDRFLPEALIPYVFAYFLGVLWERWHGKRIDNWELIIISFLTWFVVFLREPYTPAALILFGGILFTGKERVDQKNSLILFLLLSILTIFTVSFSDYLFDVFYLNLKTVFAGEIRTNNIFGSGLIKSFFYPIYIVTSIEFTFLGKILFILNLSFLSLILIKTAVLRKGLGQIFFITLILGLLALRFVPPGQMFYEAFHMLPWYGVFIMSVLLMIEDVFKSKFKKIAYLNIGVLTIILLFSLISKDSFIRENVDTIKEFNDGYARYQKHGDIIKSLSDEDDAMFSELWDDIIYWQAGLDSPYQYSLYTDLMRVFDGTTKTNRFKDLKDEMFKTNPPDFYYCSEDYHNYKELIPQFVNRSYRQLMSENRPLCLFILNDKVRELSNEEFLKMKDLKLEFID